MLGFSFSHFVARERYGSDERVDGGKTVEIWGRAPVGRSDTGVTRGWAGGNRGK